MTLKPRYPGKRSEYGGTDGSPTRLPDGSQRDLTETSTAQSVSERARLMRTAGLADYDPTRTDSVGLVNDSRSLSEMSAAEQAQYELDYAETERRKAEREKLSDKTNTYIENPEQYVGEEVGGAL